ncbi:MAG: hypothetical protein UY83_C0006G0027 [Candidatus Adlerbacteria bacterium GW2011_GWA1_54_10]|uniref:Uncharacterized protein n=1 Tax=Candidatus Adlerbacteria bacterium GW2011_GWA1_54_10 TaxID=1618605 RepID=A0A0G1XXA8_9BACT|nr:MAG: hypothetical protein UY83_C0006G0027 [Candidatus Adlerbacteria bacterium GW2011_GWA1_54_10]
MAYISVIVVPPRAHIVEGKGIGISFGALIKGFYACVSGGAMLVPCCPVIHGMRGMLCRSDFHLVVSIVDPGNRAAARDRDFLRRNEPWVTVAPTGAEFAGGAFTELVVAGVGADSAGW